MRLLNRKRSLAFAHSRNPTRDLRGALTAPTVTHYGAVTDARRVGELLRAIDGYDGQGHTKLAMQIAPHGASGSGKSALLKALDSSPVHSSGFQVKINGARNYTSAWLRPLPDNVPIFDYFAERYSPERAFGALSQVGLSEAFVLVKPAEHLSRGQQYRAMLADLILRDEQVWLLDEFCADAKFLYDVKLYQFINMLDIISAWTALGRTLDLIDMRCEVVTEAGFVHGRGSPPSSGKFGGMIGGVFFHRIYRIAGLLGFTAYIAVSATLQFSPKY